LPTGHEIQFLRIDTDADVNPIGWDRIAGRGRFLTELRTLDARLSPAKRNRIRVLLLHHSSQWRRRLTLGMSQASRAALYDLMAKKGISILLCGHTHIPWLKRFPVYSAGAESFTAIEACCGATTKLTALPMDSTLLGSRPDWHPIQNSAIIHRLSAADSGDLHWNMQLVFESAFGFEKFPHAPGFSDDITFPLR
jgi:hypothetical protein